MQWIEKKAGLLIKGTEAWVPREKQKAEWDRQGESRGMEGDEKIKEDAKENERV